MCDKLFLLNCNSWGFWGISGFGDSESCEFVDLEAWRFRGLDICRRIWRFKNWNSRALKSYKLGYRKMEKCCLPNANKQHWKSKRIIAITSWKIVSWIWTREDQENLHGECNFLTDRGLSNLKMFITVITDDTAACTMCTSYATHQSNCMHRQTVHVGVALHRAVRRIDQRP